MSSDVDGTETVQVKTRVPAHQREQWRAAADALGMSQSEFVRTMVQAGRSGFEAVKQGDESSSPEQGGHSDSNPTGNDLEARVHTALAESGVVSWEELVNALTGDFEERLEETVQQAPDIRYSGREGGYVLDGE